MLVRDDSAKSEHRQPIIARADSALRLNSRDQYPVVRLCQHYLARSRGEFFAKAQWQNESTLAVDLHQG